jgi:hypothetical protein
VALRERSVPLITGTLTRGAVEFSPGMVGAGLLWCSRPVGVRCRA